MENTSRISYRVREVADMLGTTSKTIYNWIREGRVEAVKLGPDVHCAVRITKEALDRFISSAKKEAK